MNTKNRETNAGLRAVVNTDEFRQAFAPAELSDNADFIKASHAAVEHLLQKIMITSMPNRYASIRLADFSNGIRSAVIRALAANLGLFVFGSVGAGKSALTAAILREIKYRQAEADLDLFWSEREAKGWGPRATWDEVERYVGCAFSSAISFVDMRFKNAAELMDDIKACFDAEAQRTKKQIVDEYAAIPVLVLDDLGMEKPTAFVRETFDTIINQRWLDNRLTIVTSNLSLDRLRTHYEDEGRISSRIAGMCEVVELVGDDRRMRR